MKKNLGTTERVARAAIGAGLVGMGLMRGRWLTMLGLYPLITGITGSCPVYKALGISTHETLTEEILEAVEEVPVEVAIP